MGSVFVSAFVSLGKILGSIPGVWTPSLLFWGRSLRFGNVPPPKSLYCKLGDQPLDIFREGPGEWKLGNWWTVIGDTGLFLPTFVSQRSKQYCSTTHCQRDVLCHQRTMDRNLWIWEPLLCWLSWVLHYSAKRDVWLMFYKDLKS